MNFFLFLNAIFITIPTFSDTISGKVKDNLGNTIQFATVVLYKLPDSTQIEAILTDEKGEYKFLNIKSGTYYVFASQIGYKKQSSEPIEVIKDQKISVLDLIFEEELNEIGEVKIVSKKPFVEILPDKIGRAHV